MRRNQKRRVVVTAMGVVCAIGGTLAEFRRRLFAGRCGIDRLTLFDTTGFSCGAAGQVHGDFNRRLGPHEVRRTSRCDRLGLVAAAEAVANAGEGLFDHRRETAGVVFGGGAGGMLSWETFRRTLWREGKARHPALVLAAAPCTLTHLVANKYGITGPRTTISTACSSSANAIGYAFDLIQSGALDLVITGGSEALSEMTFAGFHALKVMAPDPCRPFDAARRGLSLGEGAGMLILEERDRARRRGAAMLAEVLGYGINADAYHMTSPDPEASGMSAVMRQALVRAGVAEEDIDYINAHGTATRINDRMEALAIGNVFGPRGRRELMVSSTKSMIGHCLGASGALEAVATVLALHAQTVPPTANLTTPDPECGLQKLPATAIRHPIAHALSNSFAFGGNNTAVLFRRAQTAADSRAPEAG